MKTIKLVLVVSILFISIQSFGQQKPTVTVTSNVKYSKTPIKFNAKIAISIGASYQKYYADLDALKKGYLQVFKDENLDISKLKEDHFTYVMLGYKNPGTVYYLEVNSKKEFEKYMSVYFENATIILRNASEYESSKTPTELSKEALKKARQKAKVIAKSANKKLGKIIKIKNFNSNEFSTQEFYYTERKEIISNYKLEVEFEML